MIKRHIKRIGITALTALFLTGCWDALEVNRLNLATMVMLDRTDDRYDFTVEVAKIATGAMSGESDGAAQAYVTGSGGSFVDARNDLELLLDKPLYLGTVRVLIFTERAAQNDLAEYLLRIYEDHAYRQKVILVTTQDAPEAFTELEDETDQPIGFVIDDTIKTYSEIGHTFRRTTANYLNDILSNRGFLIHSVGVRDKQVAINGYTVFRSARQVGFIPAEDARGTMYLVAKSPTWLYRVPSEGGLATVEVKLTSRDIEPSYRDGAVRFTLRFGFTAHVQYHDGANQFPLSKAAIEEIEQRLNEHLQYEIMYAIDLSQREFQSDYLEFDEAFRLAYPDAFEKMNWQEAYPNAEMQLYTSVDVSVSDLMDLEP